jgi:hypothetical protein
MNELPHRETERGATKYSQVYALDRTLPSLEHTFSAYPSETVTVLNKLSSAT